MYKKIILILAAISTCACAAIRQENSQVQNTGLTAFSNSVRIGYFDSTNKTFDTNAFPTAFGVTSKDGIVVPAGTSNERPSGAISGFPVLRYNTQSSKFEYKFSTNGQWLGITDAEGAALIAHQNNTTNFHGLYSTNIANKADVLAVSNILVATKSDLTLIIGDITKSYIVVNGVSVPFSSMNNGFPVYANGLSYPLNIQVAVTATNSGLYKYWKWTAQVGSVSGYNFDIITPSSNTTVSGLPFLPPSSGWLDVANSSPVNINIAIRQGNVADEETLRILNDNAIFTTMSNHTNNVTNVHGIVVSNIMPNSDFISFKNTGTVSTLYSSNIICNSFGSTNAGAGVVGSEWKAFGASAGNGVIGTNWNAMGLEAGFQSKGNFWNAIGWNAGWKTTGSWWNAIGYNAAGSGTDGDRWNAIGYSAGQNATGSNWNAIGYRAGLYAVGNNWNALGAEAGYIAKGTNWNAVGQSAGSGAFGNFWTSIGWQSGFNARGDNWFAAGGYACGYNVLGSYWNAIGEETGYQTTGSYWNAIGYRAGYKTTGDYFNAFGYMAGANANGSGNTYIGNYAGQNANSSNSIFIDTFTASNSINPTNSVVYFNGNTRELNLGRTNGTVNIVGTISISDASVPTNIALASNLLTVSNNLSRVENVTYGPVPNGLAFSTNNGTIYISGPQTIAGNVIIPDYINGFPVTRLGVHTIGGDVTGLVLPNTITNISSTTFTFPTNLTSITINGIKNIDSLLLSLCKQLTNIIIGMDVTNIAFRAFVNNTNLQNITFMGNAPSDGGDIFSSLTPNLTVHYYPTASGFSKTFADRPTGVILTPAVALTTNTVAIVRYGDTNLFNTANFPNNDSPTNNNVIGSTVILNRLAVGKRSEYIDEVSGDFIGHDFIFTYDPENSNAWFVVEANNGIQLKGAATEVENATEPNHALNKQTADTIYSTTGEVAKVRSSLYGLGISLTNTQGDVSTIIGNISNSYVVVDGIYKLLFNNVYTNEGFSPHATYVSGANSLNITVENTMDLYIAGYCDVTQSYTSLLPPYNWVGGHTVEFHSGPLADEEAARIAADGVTIGNISNSYVVVDGTYKIPFSNIYPVDGSAVFTKNDGTNDWQVCYYDTGIKNAYISTNGGISAIIDSYVNSESLLPPYSGWSGGHTVEWVSGTEAKPHIPTNRASANIGELYTIGTNEQVYIRRN